MTRDALFRWGGLALALAGVAVAIGFLVHPATEGPEAVRSAAWGPSHVLLVLATGFGIAGTFALYLRQNREAGMAGFVGFLLVYVALLSFTGIAYFEAFISPGLAAGAPSALEVVGALATGGTLGTVLMWSGLGFSVGWLLLGWATYRAGVLPRWGALLVLIGGVLLGVQPFLPAVLWRAAAVVFGLGALWLGSALWSARR